MYREGQRGIKGVMGIKTGAYLLFRRFAAKHNK